MLPKNFRVVLFFISVSVFSVHASWLEQAKQSASANASSAASQNCVSGFNESKERRESKAYEQQQGYESKCSPGEAWGTCLRRLYFGR
ncbi:MAG TPA: hypothetical protein PKC21_10030 [Oligoflexia bacterium]|nr:hypothetical protein [Oligoflexia bacterium]HMR25678.1 hypothetical protein [Oligoflexia bacterium]